MSIVYYQPIRAVRDFYKIYPPVLNEEGEVDLKVLVPCVERYMAQCTGKEFKIHVHERTWSIPGKTNRIQAHLERSLDHARIYYDSNMNYCWQRYLVAKELGHLILDTEEASFAGSREQLYKLVRELLVPSLTPSQAIASERLAYIVAVELLVPWAFKERLNSMQDMSFHDIAKDFRVPEIIIEERLGEYRHICENANNLITTEIGD